MARLLLLMYLFTQLALVPWAEARQACPGTPEARLSIGVRGRVTYTDGTPTRLRSEPSASAAIVLAMPEGEEFDVIGGPVCSGSYTWWQLQLLGSTVGWAAEGDGDSYYIEPVPGLDAALESPSLNASHNVSLSGSIAYLGLDGASIWLHDLGGATPPQRIPVPPLGFVESCPSWSADGKYLVLTRSDPEGTQDELLIVDIVQGTVSTLLEPVLHWIDWLPTGPAVVYTPPINWTGGRGDFEQPQGLWVVDTTAGTTTELVPPLSGESLIEPVVSPDGGKVAYHTTDYFEGWTSFGVADLSRGTKFAWSESVSDANWSPDSARIVFVRQRSDCLGPCGGELVVADPTGANQKVLVAGEANTNLYFPRWSPTGNNIAFVRTDFSTGTSSTYVITPDGANLRRIAPSAVAPIDWSPDGASFLLSSPEDNIQLHFLHGSPPLTISRGRCPRFWSSSTPSLSQVVASEYGILPPFDGVEVLNDDAERIKLIWTLEGQYAFQASPEHPWHSMSVEELRLQLVWLESGADGGLNGRSPSVSDTLFVNGILNSPDDHQQSIQLIEQTLKRPVTGIYNLTGGMLGLPDFGQSLGDWLDQMVLNLPLHDNLAVRSLKDQIKWQFSTKPSDFTLTIIAHSQGALITAEALQQLANDPTWNFPGFSQRIDVVTLGGAAFNFPRGPRYHHYVHYGDPVAGYGAALTPSAMATVIERARSENSKCPWSPVDAFGLIDNHSLCSYMENYWRFQMNLPQPFSGGGGAW